MFYVFGMACSSLQQRVQFPFSPPLAMFCALRGRKTHTGWLPPCVVNVGITGRPLHDRCGASCIAEVSSAHAAHSTPGAEFS